MIDNSKGGYTPIPSISLQKKMLEIK
jgi:hypothetical protein